MQRKEEKEAMQYNPYGLGGAGAPLRDPSGHDTADLRMRAKMLGQPLVSAMYTIISYLAD